MEDLKKITDGMKEEGLRSKMEDILLVMENFEDYIKERYLISEQLLDVLAQKVERSEKLKNATFYLDGFTGFTPIQKSSGKVIKDREKCICWIDFRWTLCEKSVP